MTDETPPHVLVVKEKVGRWLADGGTVQVTNAGGFTIRHGSARLFIEVRPWGEDSSLVKIIAPLVFHVAPSPELFEHIARHSHDYLFGHLGVTEDDDGSMTILFGHTLLGDFLDPDELMHAIYGIAGTGDELDTELAERFGGDTFHDDVEDEEG